MNLKKIIILLLFLIPIKSICQDLHDEYKVMFYNVENLFDTINDPLTEDDEFLPLGLKKWNGEKYGHKLVDIYKVIIAAGKWEPPVLVGFSEIENKQVLQDLIDLPPLKQFNYDVIHYNSPDKRGIDVGLIYRSDILLPISSSSIPVETPSPTRDILLFSGQIGNDTVFFFINHWPSRISGKEHTESLRIKACNTLIKNIDSLYSIYDNPKIIVMGDFNDEPDDKSVSLLINKEFRDKNDSTFLFIGHDKVDDEGTTVYTDVFRNWYFFDQILVSNNLKIATEFSIIKFNWLLNYQGVPSRTYLGNYYNGGVSDHLPVIMGLYFNN